MPVTRRTLASILVAVAVFFVPTLGWVPAQAVGTGKPAIVTPEDGVNYPAYATPDFVVNFADAPYGSYYWSVTDDANQVLYSGTVMYAAGDPATKDLQSLSGLAYTFWTASVTGSTGTVSSYFSAGPIADPPPYACTIEVPAQVRVISPITAVYARFHHCRGWDMKWAVRHRVGGQDVRFGTLGVKVGRSIGPWRYRDSWPTGTYRVVPPPVGGPNTTQLSVKFGSRVTLAAGAKTAGHFKLSGDVSRYVASVDGWHGWANHAVAISYKNCASGCQWRYFGTTRSDASGHYGLLSTSSLVRYWRATVADTASVWGSKSAAVKR
ncbi:MAG: hypothetical protein ACJ716_05215 [Marmoricola sp.]